METDRKTIFLTEEQIKSVHSAVLRESLVVNSEFVKSMVKYLNKHFRPVKYDDINEDGDVIQNYAMQVLGSSREPLQTISVERLLGKLDSKFHHKIKDNEDRQKFFKQLVEDWIAGNISKNGDLTVNIIKEKKK